MSSLPRAVTSEEQAYLAAENQASKVYAIFDNPQIVFACRINQTFSTQDNIAQFIYDGVTTGIYTDVKPGMTVLIGTAPGLEDAGRTFAWATPTASTFYCGKTSSVAWANDLYVTVLLDYGIWPCQLPTYTNQHEHFRPIMRIGGDRVVKLAGESVTIQLDASESSVTGGTIASYAWSCSGGALTDADEAVASLTITAPGRYVFGCQGTSDQGVAAETWRVLHVWNADQRPAEVEVNAWEWDLARGGAEAVLNFWAPTSLRDRAKVILFGEDYYVGVQVSLGILPGCENIVISGWVDNPNDEINRTGGNVRLIVRGTQYWLAKMTNLAYNLTQVSGTPGGWNEMTALTVDALLEFVVARMTTLTNCVDVYFSGNTQAVPNLEMRPGTVWEQIKQLADQKLKATPACDPYGRLFVRVDTCLVPSTEREAIPVVMAIDHDNFETASLEERTVSTCCKVLLSGQTLTGETVYSLAPGHQPQAHGDPVELSQLLVESQAKANELAGNVLEMENCPLQLTLNNLAYNPLVGVWPPQRISLAIASEDTPSGVVYNGYALVRNIRRSFAAQVWSTSWSLAVETTAKLFCNGDIPETSSDGSGEVISWSLPAFPEFPAYRPPVIAPPPAVRPLVPLGIVAALVDNYGVFVTSDLDGISPTWVLATTAADWSSAEINALVGFELNAYGRAYLYSANTAWSQVLGLAGRVTIGDSAFFLAHPAQASYLIKGIGINPASDKTCVLALKSSVAENGCFYKTNAATGLLEYKSAYYPVMSALDRSGRTNYQLSHYGSKWYLSWEDYLGGARILRLSDALAAENDLFYGTYGGPHVHATASDYIFGQAQTGIGRIISTATAQSNVNENNRQEFQNVACDPTGQRLLTVNTSAKKLRRSYTGGLFWDDTPAFPHAIAEGSARILNMGDVDKWLVFSRVSSTDPLLNNLLTAYYTDDSGETWISKLGNLATLTATTASVRAVRYA